MKQSIITGLFLLLSVLGFPQKEFNNWYFGGYTAITFNSDPPTILTNNPSNDGGAHLDITVSDSTGSLLFFSSGTKAYDRNFSVMPNGDNLFGGTSTGDGQFIIVVPSLNDKNKYYLFTVGFYGGPFTPSVVGLHYSVLDMQLHGGFGDIMPGEKNLPLYMGDSAVNQITAIRHQNNRDAWVVTLKHGIGKAYYLAYLVTSTGIAGTPVVSQSSIQRSYWGVSNVTTDAHLRISPDGKFLISRDSLTEVCDFNSSTGIVTPKFTFKHSGGDSIAGGYEFSINSKYLYTANSYIADSGNYGYLVQYDMNDQDSLSFLQNRVIIGDSAGENIHMAPDGKIYLNNCWNPKYLNVINFPSQPGLSCGYQKDILFFPGPNWKRYYNSLCTFLQRYKAFVHHTGYCIGDSIHFTSDIWPPADSIHWDFGDPASIGSNFSNLPNPVHLFSGPGTYTVELWVRHNDKRTETTWVTIEFPNPQLGPDRTICTGESTTFDAGYCEGCTYLWTNLTTMQTLGTTQMITTGTPGLIMVAVTNAYTCTAMDTVQLSLTPMPVITNTPLSKTICSGESTNIVLTSSVANTMFDWTATVISGTVTGASADSGLIINQVLMNPGPNPGVVRYHITPHMGSCIGDTANYLVTVNPSLPVDVSISVSANPVCAGTLVTFTATPANGGTAPNYQWKVNGINFGANSPVYTYIPANGDLVSCVLTSSEICTSNNPASSIPVLMVVDNYVPVSVSITASSNPFCPGSSVTFTATPTNGGTSPQYQWKVNGINVGSNISTYTYNPANGDQVTCGLTSNLLCTTNNPATSNTVTMIINNSLPAGVSIVANPNPFCPGVTVNYTATPVNGGTAPSYQWKVNGNIAGTNSPNFSFSPQPGDSIWCIMTSNLSCVSGNPTTSNKIAMVSAPVPAVTFTLCFDSITTISAKPIKLKGGIPLGGTYSGPGVNSLTGVFTPSLAGIGTKTITYSYTNVALCSASKTKTIIVQSAPAFTCGNNLTDIRDAKVYLTVQIGSQCWMAANLNYGNRVPSAGHQRDNCVPEKYCYNDLTANCELGTANYQWDELMQYDDTPGLKGLCPPGWHVPIEAEWNTLFANWTNNAFAAAPLKYSGYSGFNALLSGVRHKNVQWDYQNFATFFWSSTPYGTYKAWAHGMNDYDPSVSLYPASRANAFSTRCLKD